MTIRPHAEQASGVSPDADLACDVLVVGTGPGGMAAVAAAAGTGAEVHAVESLDAIGGNSVWSTGYMAFVGSRAQAEAGIVDSVERFVEDAEHSIGLLRDLRNAAQSVNNLVTALERRPNSVLFGR